MPTFEDIKNNILPFINEYGIKRVGIFGSFARGEAKESSDIDLFKSNKDLPVLKEQIIKIISSEFS